MSIALTHASSMRHCQIVVTPPFQANPESWKKIGISHLTAGLRHARSISDVTQVLQSASRLMYFNVQNPTGHYRRRSSAGGEILPLASENQRDHVTLGWLFFGIMFANNWATVTCVLLVAAICMCRYTWVWWMHSAVTFGVLVLQNPQVSE